MPKQVRFLSSSVGTQNFGAQAYWMEQAYKQFKIPAGAFPGSSEFNLAVVDRGDAEFSYGDPIIFSQAYNGTPPFTKPLANLRWVTGLGISIAAAAVRADSPLKSITELQGKRVGLGVKGSGSERGALALLGAVGITPESIQKAGGMTTSQDYAAMGEAIGSKTLDAAWFLSGPTTVHSAFALTDQRFGTRLLDVQNAVEAALKKEPLLDKGTIQGGIYKGNPQPYSSIGVATTIATRADLSEDFVYQVLKLIYSDPVASYTRKQFPLWNEFGDNRIGLLGVKVMPVHPGAAKFWKEKGVDLAAIGATVK